MSKSNKKVKHVEIVEESQEAVVDKKVVEVPKLTKQQQDEFDALKTKSAQIRYVASQGFNKGQIAKFMNIRYQHVFNVLQTTLKRPLKQDKQKKNDIA